MLQKQGIEQSASPNLIVVSDLHCGCRLGLCPPEGAALDDGGRYMPSRLQKKVWTWWREFWDEWVPRVTRNEPWDLCVNGDAIDGVHHGSVTQISHNLEDQGELAYCVLRPIVAQAVKYYHIRGTEAHVGKSGVEEERLAKRLNAIPNEDGQHARWELWKQVGIETARQPAPLCHILHHIGTTGRVAYETSAVQAELIAEFTEAGQNRDVPPDYVIRSHRHRYIKGQNPSDRPEAGGLVSAGWQLKTPFVWKIPGGRVSQPQFGGILVRQGDEEFYTRFKRWRLGRAKVEV